MMGTDVFGSSRVEMVVAVTALVFLLLQANAGVVLAVFAAVGLIVVAAASLGGPFSQEAAFSVGQRIMFLCVVEAVAVAVAVIVTVTVTAVRPQNGMVGMMQVEQEATFFVPCLWFFLLIFFICSLNFSRKKKEEKGSKGKNYF